MTKGLHATNRVFPVPEKNAPHGFDMFDEFTSIHQTTSSSTLCTQEMAPLASSS